MTPYFARLSSREFYIVSPSNPSAGSKNLLVMQKSVWTGEISFDSLNGRETFPIIYKCENVTPERFKSLD